MKKFRQIYDKNGNCRLDKSYTEILKLDKMLTEANIPHTLDRFLDGWQVIYSVNGKRIADAVQHCGSYGNEENLIEIMGLIKPEETSDSVLGYLTARDVFNRINKHYSATKQRKEMLNNA